MPSSATLMPTRLSPASIPSLLDGVDYILLDIDGVLWAGDHVFEGVPETLEFLRQANKKIRFLSNNSTMSRSTTAKKFQNKGLKGVTEGEIYTSAYAAALHLASVYRPQHAAQLPTGNNVVDTNVFIIGELGLHEEIRKVLAPGHITYGLELNGGAYKATDVMHAIRRPLLPKPEAPSSHPHPGPKTSAADAAIDAPGSSAGVSLEGLNCGVVVAGLDTHFNMLKLATAGLCLQRRPLYVAAHNSPTVRYVATNEDPQLPIGKEGHVFPGAGCIIQALNTVSGRLPDTVCGKPHLHMAKLLFDAEGIRDPSRCLMIGDRLTTDIAFGNGAGCKTLLVLTGCEGLKEVDDAVRGGQQHLIPTYIADSLASLWTGHRHRQSTEGRVGRPKL